MVHTSNSDILGSSTNGLHCNTISVYKINSRPVAIGIALVTSFTVLVATVVTTSKHEHENKMCACSARIHFVRSLRTQAFPVYACPLCEIIVHGLHTYQYVYVWWCECGSCKLHTHICVLWPQSSSCAQLYIMAMALDRYGFVSADLE